MLKDSNRRQGTTNYGISGKSSIGCSNPCSVFAAGIIAEIGQIDRFDDETKVAKYASLYWRKHQSGRFTAEDTSLSRNGNYYLRYYLVEAANC